jgi:ABC-type glycerol-3-phosphate transport system substrate-binding protein
VGGNYLVAFNTSKHLDEAISFVNWITSPEVQAVYAKNFGLLPANKLAADVAYSSPDATAAVKGFQQDLENSPRYAATDQAWPEMQAGVWDAVKASVTSVVSGQSTAEDAVATLHAGAIGRSSAIGAGRQRVSFDSQAGPVGPICCSCRRSPCSLPSPSIRCCKACG